MLTCRRQDHSVGWKEGLYCYQESLKSGNQPQSLNMPVRAFPGLGVWVVASALAEVCIPLDLKAGGEVAGGQMAW